MGRVAPVQLRACPAGTLAACRRPVGPKNLLASPHWGCGSWQNQGELCEHNTMEDSVAVAVGRSTAEAGLTWAALELEREPDMARHRDVYHAPCGQQLCFPPSAAAGPTSFLVQGAGGTVAHCLLAGFCFCSQLRGVKSCQCQGQQCPQSSTGVSWEGLRHGRMFAISYGQKGPHGALSACELVTKPPKGPGGWSRAGAGLLLLQPLQPP